MKKVKFQFSIAHSGQYAVAGDVREFDENVAQWLTGNGYGNIIDDGKDRSNINNGTGIEDSAPTELPVKGRAKKGV